MKNRKRWRTILAYVLVFSSVTIVLTNLVSDALVSHYDSSAPRDPASGFLEGMAPRSLGPEESKNAVLFVHGFVGSQSNFNTLPDAVAAAGWYVETMRLPGHGTSPRDFERISPDELLAGVSEAISSMKARYGTVVVVAHSMGGALSTLAVSKEPVNGLVLCAPFFGLTHDRIFGIKTSWLAHHAAPFIRWLPGRPGNGPVAKPEGRRKVQSYGWIPMAGALTAFEIEQRVSDPTVLSRLSMPVLAIHSMADTVTSPSATARAIEMMTSASTETVWLEKSNHVIFWDYEEETVRERTLGFLEEMAD